MRETLSGWTLWMLLVVVVGWRTPAWAADRAADAALQAFFEQEWENGLRESPTWASSLGDDRYNALWDDVSLAAIERRQREAEQSLARLQGMERESLSIENRLNYRLYERKLKLAIDGAAFRWFLVPLTQREGIQDAATLTEVLPFASVKNYEDWLQRIERFPAFMAQVMALMRQGLAERRLQPKICMQRVPGQIRQQIVERPEESRFYRPFQQFPADFAAAEKNRLRDAAQAAIAQHIVPQYREFLAFFENEYLPACYERAGIWQYPEGDAYYRHVAREHTTTEMTPDEIHELGLREVARLRAAMEEVRKQVGFAGDLQAFFEHLRTAPEHHFTDAKDLLQAYQAFCKRVDPTLPKMFRKLPRIPYGIEPIPAHMAPDTTAAYYQEPAADGSRAGLYYVNLHRPETRYKWEIPALSLHEAVPGHHLQIALANEQTDLPNFRRYGHVTAYVEGWALYAESLGEELGFYRDPYDKFGQLTYEMWRAIRLVVDTGLHAKRWTRDEAITYFSQNAPRSPLDIRNEVDRYISWPGQALAYKVGQLKILELRHRAKEQLGVRFNVREFHDVILSPGAIPLDVLEDVVTEWITGKMAVAK